LARQQDTTMQGILEQALDQFERNLMLSETVSAYAAFESDAAARQEYQREQALYDHALMDGLENLDDGDALDAMYMETTGKPRRPHPVSTG
jgi:hypothetical protein